MICDCDCILANCARPAQQLVLRMAYGLGTFGFDELKLSIVLDVYYSFLRGWKLLTDGRYWMN